MLGTNIDDQMVGRLSEEASPYRVVIKLIEGLNLGVELVELILGQRMPLDRPYERPSSICS